MSSTSWNRLATFLTLALSGCHASHDGGAAGSASSGVALTAAPLDTSWQRSPGRLLAAGDVAPDFEGIAHTGMRVRLSAFTERPVVVLFYPGDRDPASVTEVREFRDAWLRFGDKIGMVIGVSPDDRVLHKDFATGEELPFLLVSDTGGAIARAFGVASENGVTKRTTFLVGKGLKVLRVFPDVVAAGHATDVLHAVEGPS
ncbi:MAG TPA: redoxin domain-containing protein [Polyangiaceae bacterium]|nr:redoxin domain-containing protein [Polyangiaceae bacterium]